MRKVYESFKISFSMYSRIPMPRSDWSKENMSYVMCFFPFVGVAIGLLMYGISCLQQYCGAQQLAFSSLFWECVYLLLPVIVTGGIHIDGFLDTSDALSSWQPKDRRLEILKDSHAGAFAIICGITYFVWYLGIYSCLTSENLKVIAMTFMLSRILSGISVLSFPQARKKGTVQNFSEKAEKKRSMIVLLAELTVLCVGLLVVGRVQGAVAIVTALLVFVYYRHMAMDKFGGVTGDLAGWFLQMCEILTATAVILTGCLKL